MTAAAFDPQVGYVAKVWSLKLINAVLAVTT